MANPSLFPASLDSITFGVSGANTLSTAPNGGHTNWHDLESGMAVNLETKVGIDNSTDNNSQDYRIRQGWNKESHTPTYVSASSYTVSGNQTAVYTQGRLVRFNYTTSPISLVVTSSTYNSGPNTTTVNVVGGTVPNPINSADYGLQPAGSTIPYGTYTQLFAGYGTSIVNTASTTMVNINSTVVSITTTQGVLGIELCCGVSCSVAGNRIGIQILVDTTPYMNVAVTSSNAASSGNENIYSAAVVVSGLSNATHTIKPQFAVADSGTVYIAARSLIIREFAGNFNSFSF